MFISTTNFQGHPIWINTKAIRIITHVTTEVRDRDVTRFAQYEPESLVVEIWDSSDRIVIPSAHVADFLRQLNRDPLADQGSTQNETKPEPVMIPAEQTRQTTTQPPQQQLPAGHALKTQSNQQNQFRNKHNRR